MLIIAGQGFLFSIFAQWPEEEKEVQYNNLPISQIIDSLSKEFKVNFSYDADLEIFSQTRSLNKKGKLDFLLQSLFKSSNIDFSIIDKQVILFAVVKPETGVGVNKEKAVSKIVEGRILDYSGIEALSYAAIGILGTSISTVANSEGRFSLKIPVENLNDSIFISYLGYKSQVFAINSIPEEEWLVKLHEHTTQIGAVHVKPVTAEDIIKEMLERIPKNYLRRNAMYTAFYREITSNEKYILSLNEALLDIAKAPYGSTFLNDQARIFRGRKEEDSSKIKKLAIKLEGGIYNSLRLDVIKEEAAFLSWEGMKNYDFKYRKVIHYDGKNLHVIDFGGKKYIDDIAYQGTLYIEVESKALVAAKFEMSPEGLKYARSSLVKKQPRKTNIKPIAANYITYYKNYNGKYYLHYTRAELIVKAKSDRLFVNEKFIAVAELAVTDIDTTNTTRFKWSDISKSNQILYEQLGYYKESYWGNYNIISPGSQINKALENFKSLKKRDED